jgi:hypothetical protein
VKCEKCGLTRTISSCSFEEFEERLTELGWSKEGNFRICSKCKTKEIGSKMKLEEIEQVINDIRFEEVRVSELSQVLYAFRSKQLAMEERTTITSNGYSCYVSTQAFLALVTRELEEVKNRIATLKSKIGVE